MYNENILYHEPNISAVTSTPKDITTAVDQTLTCTIGGLDANSGTPATVTWKDNVGDVVEISDTQNYGLEQGSVDGSGNQVAELTIKAAKLAAFTSLSSVTYKCSVKSGQYADSPTSDYVDIVANILKLGECNIFMLPVLFIMLLIREV